MKQRIEAFMARLLREDVCLHGFILSVDGQEKASAYYAPFREGQPHRLYSVSKSITALALGILIDDGKLQLSDHITDFFADYLPENPDERLLRLTISDMLRMATCYRNTAYREGIDENWTKPFFTAASTHEPGTVFHYDTGCSQVLASLVQRISGQDVMDFLNDRLFKKIGAADEKFWLRDPSGACTGGTGLCMSLRDMHKTAQVMLDGGGGIVPKWFCEEMGKCHIGTEMQTNEEEKYGYGWQCWRTRAGYAWYGLGAQLAVFCPEKNVLFSTIADTRLDPVGVQRIYNAFFEEVYPYIGQEDMPCTRYEKAVQAVPHAPQYQRDYPGVYAFAPNMLGFVSVELRSGELIIENAKGKNPMRFGMGENIVDTFPGWPDVPTLCSAGWIAEGLLRIRCFVIGNAPCGVDMLLRFKGNSLTVQARKSFDPVTNQFEGVATGYLY